VSDIKSDRTWRYQVPERGSKAIEVLESAWKMLRQIEPEIPPAVLTFVDFRSRRKVLGYFARSIWRKRRGSAHEIALNPVLIGDVESLLATMIHEAAHAALYEAGLNGGIGSTPYYHTRKFRDKCLAFGLACEFLNTRYGWTVTFWKGSKVPPQFKPVVNLLRQELPAGTGGRTKLKRKGNPLPAPGHTLLVCECDDDDRTIYVKKSMLEAGGVICVFCGKEFRKRSSSI
jgi:hypothetical protein